MKRLLGFLLVAAMIVSFGLGCTPATTTKAPVKTPAPTTGDKDKDK